MTQVVPVPVAVVNIPGRMSTAGFELIFSAAGIPPLGFKSFYVSEIYSKHSTEANNFSENESATFMGGDVCMKFSKKETKMYFF